MFSKKKNIKSEGIFLIFSEIGLKQKCLHHRHCLYFYHLQVLERKKNHSTIRMLTIWHTELQKISIHFLTFGRLFKHPEIYLFLNQCIHESSFLLGYRESKIIPSTYKLQFLVRNVCQSLSYAKEPLQESFGSTEINAGDATITPEHAIHRGGNLLPVTLCIGVEGCLVFCNVPHPVTDKPFTLRRTPMP